MTGHNVNTVDKIKTKLNQVKGSWPMLSVRSGVSYMTIVRIANGATKNPRIETCETLLRHLSRKGR